MTRESQPFYIRFLFELFVSLSLKSAKRGEDISVFIFFIVSYLVLELPGDEDLPDGSLT